MRCLWITFVTAGCFRLLLKLKWPKSKNTYDVTCRVPENYWKLYFLEGDTYDCFSIESILEHVEGTHWSLEDATTHGTNFSLPISPCAPTSPRAACWMKMYEDDWERVSRRPPSSNLHGSKSELLLWYRATRWRAVFMKSVHTAEPNYLRLLGKR